MRAGVTTLMMRTLAAITRVAPVCALVVVAGCYNPEIGDGAFLCGPAPQRACPVGFQCRPADNRCYREITSVADAAVELAPPPPPDAMTMMCPQTVTCSRGATAGALCDPVCQSGCACDKKCFYKGSQLACGAVPQPPKMLYDECNPADDNCAPGLVCTEELRPELCGSRCYRACRDNSDCGPNARCTDALGDSTGKLLTKICSPRIEGCNPIGAQTACANSGPGSRPFPNFACYLLDPSVDESTVCRCAGAADLGAACGARGDCKPGLECLAGLGPADMGLRCRRLCNLMGVGVACQVGNLCRPIGAASTRIGACI